MKSLPIIISVLSLGISGATAWLTVFRRGRLRMTHPNVIAFAFDGADGPPKIFFRSLLFSTARRGHVIEGMYLRLSNPKVSHVFSDWGYGDDRLTFGSGLNVPYEGFASNHHFLLPKTETGFNFQEGEHNIEVYARVVHKKSTLLLSQLRLSLNEPEAKILNERRHVIFTWDPIKETYSVSQRAPKSFEILFEV
jgi:hypothetical protein